MHFICFTGPKRYVAVHVNAGMCSACSVCGVMDTTLLGKTAICCKLLQMHVKAKKEDGKIPIAIQYETMRHFPFISMYISDTERLKGYYSFSHVLQKETPLHGLFDTYETPKIRTLWHKLLFGVH